MGGEKHVFEKTLHSPTSMNLNRQMAMAGYCFKISALYIRCEAGRFSLAT